jgi:FkbM family methyltransferase
MSLLPEITLRSLPAFRGKLRLAKYLLRDLRGPVVVKDRSGFAYEIPDVREPIGFHLFVNGIYEPEIQKLILRSLKPGGVFIDVGASIGVFTIPAAKRVGSFGRVIAMEASPDVFATLGRNVATNGLDNVELICAAAGESHADTNFYPAPVDHFGMGSRAAQFDVAPITVNCVTLDSLAEKFNLSAVEVIKIDVEGFEVDVLAGALGLLGAEKPPVVIFEFCDWAEARRSRNEIGAAQRLLMDLGFTIWRASEYDRAAPIKTALDIGSDMLVARRT